MDYHEYSPGDHCFRSLVPKQNQLNLSSKRELIEEIILVRSEAKSEKNRITKSAAEMIRNLEIEAKTNIKKLNEFICVCDDVIKQIYSIVIIPQKNVYSPLESVLMSSEINNVLQQIVSPDIYIEKCIPEISYSASDFPSYLYNYTDKTITYSGNTIDVSASVSSNELTNVNHYRCPLSNFCCLNAGNDKIIITGGNQAFTLNLIDNSIISIPDIQYDRHNHTMAWVEGYPSVIGGTRGSSYFTQVEILKDNEWLEISPLNVGRDCLTSTSGHKNTWVLGDIPGSTDNILSIEVYGEKLWKLVEITTTTLYKCNSISLTCNENNLILLTGSDTYIVDTECGTLIEKMDGNAGQYHSGYWGCPNGRNYRNLNRRQAPQGREEIQRRSHGARRGPGGGREPRRGRRRAREPRETRGTRDANIESNSEV